MTSNNKPGRDLLPGTERSLQIARVVQYHSGFNYYTVVPLQGGLPRKAVAGGGNAGLGAMPHCVYAPGTPVIIMDTPGHGDAGSRAQYFDIIGALTGITASQALSPCDSSDLLCGAGYLFDKIHSFLPDQRTDKCRPVAAGGGVNIDALSGEESVVAPLGPGWLVGLALAYLRASERCGIWMFRLDEHLRAVAKSMEVQTMAREVLDVYDDGEVSVIERVAFVPWEALGAFEPGVATGVLSDSKFNDPKNSPKEFPIKTVEVDQVSVFRSMVLKGYLGDLQDSFTVLPVGAKGISKAGGAPEVLQGVFREIRSADGSYTVQSAKGIHFEKYPLIQVPVELRAPGDPEGDTPENYKASGVYGAGATQERKDFKPENNGCPGDRGILGLARHGAYISKAALQTLRAHKKDWRVQNESEVPFAKLGLRGTFTRAAGFGVDPKAMWMELPMHIEQPVQSGRWASTRYYAGRSAIDLWDDGSVVLEDAWGSQVIMAGGNIALTCPGDIIMAPGRSVITMAPQDIVQRAGNSVDITATRRDVTIKAEVNCKVIGGNSGARGGVIIDNRSQSQSFDYQQNGEKTDVAGLVLRSSGAVGILGDRVSVMSDGELAFQASKIYGTGVTMHFEAATEFNVVLGDTSQLVKDIGKKVSYVFKQNICLLGTGGAPEIIAGGKVVVDGGVEVRGALACGGAMQVGGSSTFAGGITSTSAQNTEMSAGSAQAIRADINKRIKEVMDTQVKKAMENIVTLRTRIAELLNKASTYFSKVDVKAYAKGSLRTPKDYRTDGPKGFILAQWRWQTYLQGSGGTWEETKVRGNAGETTPWPGDAWTTSGSYLVYDLKVFDVEAGRSTDGEDSPAPTVARKSAKDAYLVNSSET